MRNILIIVLLFIGVSAYAQKMDKTGEMYEYYCTIQVTSPLDHHKEATICLNGEDKYTLLDDENQMIIFHNQAELINYMIKKGWQYIDTEIYGRPYTIMKKIVKSEEEARDGLKLASWPYKNPRKKKD